MKSFLFTLFFLMFASFAEGQRLDLSESHFEKGSGKIFGVEFDEVWFVDRKPSIGGRPKLLFSDKGRVVAGNVKGALKLKSIKRLKDIFGQKEYFNEGFADIGLYLNSLVFYRKGKVVQVITPNLLGMDFGAKIKTKGMPNSWSEKGMREWNFFTQNQLHSILRKEVKEREVLPHSK